MAGGAQRQRLQACLPDGHKPQCLFSPSLFLISQSSPQQLDMVSPQLPRNSPRNSPDAHARNDVACVCLTSVLLCLTVTMIEEGVHMERINVRVDERLKQELETEAREKGVRPSDIVRQALEEHMRSRTPSPNCRDLAERLGLIGSAKGLPADLSTNPEHMEGFGRG